MKAVHEIAQQIVKDMIAQFETLKEGRWDGDKFIESTHPDDAGMNWGINRCIERAQDMLN